MKRDDLRDAVWKSLPYLRKQMLGRERIDRITDLVIDRAPLEVMPYVDRGSNEEEVVCLAWQSAVKMRYCTMYGEDAIQFGPLFWIIVSPLIQYAIKAIIEWWFQSRANRVLLAGWRKEGVL
jgi:hypothetical protein